MSSFEQVSFVPPDVVEAYGLDSKSIEPLEGGHVNQSFTASRADLSGNEKVVVQGLPLDNADEALRFLKNERTIYDKLGQSAVFNLAAPKYVEPSQNGGVGPFVVVEDGTVWRVRTFIPVSYTHLTLPTTPYV